MEIHVFSRAEIEAGVLIRCAYAVISIRDPGKHRAKVKAQVGLREVLFLAFHDAEPSANFALPPEIRPITPAQGNEICNFVRKHQQTVGAFAVHCEQGMSRSPAVAAAICEALGLDGKRFWQRHAPNRYVYHMVANAFEGAAAKPCKT